MLKTHRRCEARARGVRAQADGAAFESSLGGSGDVCKLETRRAANFDQSAKACDALCARLHDAEIAPKLGSAATATRTPPPAFDARRVAAMYEKGARGPARPGRLAAYFSGRILDAYRVLFDANEDAHHKALDAAEAQARGAAQSLARCEEHKKAALEQLEVLRAEVVAVSGEKMRVEAQHKAALDRARTLEGEGDALRRRADEAHQDLRGARERLESEQHVAGAAPRPAGGRGGREGGDVVQVGGARGRAGRAPARRGGGARNWGRSANGRRRQGRARRRGARGRGRRGATARRRGAPRPGGARRDFRESGAGRADRGARRRTRASGRDPRGAGGARTQRRGAPRGGGGAPVPGRRRGGTGRGAKRRRRVARGGRGAPARAPPRKKSWRRRSGACRRRRRPSRPRGRIYRALADARDEALSVERARKRADGERAELVRKAAQRTEYLQQQLDAHRSGKAAGGGPLAREKTQTDSTTRGAHALRAVNAERASTAEARIHLLEKQLEQAKQAPRGRAAAASLKSSLESSARPS